ncbi:MAG TPA: hypothetical protein PK892_14130 [Bacteroidales bacterium]|nr:hypothetical protein [Bacteroidales bacterium]
MQFLAGLVLLLLTSLVILIVAMRYQRKKIRLKNREIDLTKKMIEFEEHQTTLLGRELHDAVSNLMQRLAGFFRNARESDGISGQETTEKIEEMLGSVRSLAHRMNKVDFSRSSLGDLLLELKSDMITLTGMRLSMEIPENMPPLAEPMVRQTYRMIQEMLTNARKYACDAEIIVMLGATRNRLVVTYRDDGPGFDPLVKGHSGIGLTGIRERAGFLGGTAILETAPGNGLTWIVSLPFNQLFPGHHD